MGVVTSWGETIRVSLVNLWDAFIDFLPDFLAALIIFIVGWIISAGIGKLVTQILRALRINQGLDRLGIKRRLKKAGADFDVNVVLGKLVEWFLVIVFLMAAVDILGLTEVTAFLKAVLFYIPNIIIAGLILIAGVLVADLLFRVVRGSVKTAGLKSADFIASVAKWSVLIFAILAALVQLNVAASFIQTLFTGVIAMLALAAGLAFGLGGREQAADFLKKLRHDVTEKK